MKKNKQKKKQQRAEQLYMKLLNTIGIARVNANHDKLSHVNYLSLPKYYTGKQFTCRDCGCEQVWTALQQKVYYEEWKGPIDAKAIRCKACRTKIKQRKKEQQKHMQEMSLKQPHPNEMFFRDLGKF
jgi:hypothetical protein